MHSMNRETFLKLLSNPNGTLHFFQKESTVAQRLEQILPKLCVLFLVYQDRSKHSLTMVQVCPFVRDFVQVPLWSNQALGTYFMKGCPENICMTMQDFIDAYPVPGRQGRFKVVFTGQKNDFFKFDVVLDIGHWLGVMNYSPRHRVALKMNFKAVDIEAEMLATLSESQRVNEECY